MAHRTQLHLSPDQYRWLKQRAGQRGSIAAVVRDLIDAERARGTATDADPLIRYLAEEMPGEGAAPSSVKTLDQDLYG